MSIHCTLMTLLVLFTLLLCSHASPCGKFDETFASVGAKASLALEFDGDDDRFVFSGKVWESNDLIYKGGAGSAYKSEAYFLETHIVILEMESGGVCNSVEIVLDQPESLLSLMTHGKGLGTVSEGCLLQSFQDLVVGRGHQENCNEAGFKLTGIDVWESNLDGLDGNFRLGIFFNDQDSCTTVDSGIGIGNGKFAAGNFCRYGSGSCDGLKSAKRARVLIVDENNFQLALSTQGGKPLTDGNSTLNWEPTCEPKSINAGPAWAVVLGSLGWLHWIVWHWGCQQPRWQDDPCISNGKFFESPAVKNNPGKVTFQLTAAIIMEICMIVSGDALLGSQLEGVGISFIFWGSWGLLWTTKAWLAVCRKSSQEAVTGASAGAYAPAGAYAYNKMTVASNRGTHCGEDPKYMLDNSTRANNQFRTSKWNSHKSFPIELSLTLQDEVHLSSYDLKSANDCPNRDPTAWKLYGVSSSGERLLLSEVRGGSPFGGARWHWKKFTCDKPGASGRFRMFVLSITANAGCGSCCQLGQIALYPKQSATNHAALYPMQSATNHAASVIIPEVGGHGYKIEFTATKNSSANFTLSDHRDGRGNFRDSLQMSTLIVFDDKGNRVQVRNAKCLRGRPASSNEGPNKVESDSGKWIDLDFRKNGCRSILEFSCAQKIHSYQFVTGGDGRGRDPSSWDMTSTDTNELLDRRSNQQLPERRNAKTEVWGLNYSPLGLGPPVAITAETATFIPTALAVNDVKVCNFCPNCGAKTVDSAQFCTECGLKL